jgi:flavin reductase (DIM6/NTAB) family NADH-FMN oxidoreductase RutF
MKQRLEQTSLFCLPWTQTILGTHLQGRINFMALDWLTRVNFNPAMLGICVNRLNGSYEAIMDTKEFSINVPSIDMVVETDYTGLVSGKRIDKSHLFEVFYGELAAAPMIRKCPLTMECRVTQQVELPTNCFFIADLVGLYSEEQYLTDNKPDADKIKPFLLTMPENRYWAIGECVGKAWSAGKALLAKVGGSHS